MAATPIGPGLHPARRRRRHLHVRRRALPRFDRRHAPQRARARPRDDARAATATGSSRPTVACSRSATRSSTARPAAMHLAAPVMSMTSATRRTAATGWSRPTAASSPSTCRSRAACPASARSTGAPFVPTVRMRALPSGDGYYLLGVDGSVSVVRHRAVLRFGVARTARSTSCSRRERDRRSGRGCARAAPSERGRRATALAPRTGRRVRAVDAETG